MHPLVTNVRNKYLAYVLIRGDAGEAAVEVMGPSRKFTDVGR